MAISPCLFPLLPTFLLRNLQATDSRKKAVIVTGFLILGILSSLAIYSVISIFIGLFLLQNQTLIQAILGALIIFFGIVTMSERLQSIFHLTSLNIRNPPEKPGGLVSVFFIGLGFSLLAAPCSGSAVIAFLLYVSTVSNILMFSLIFLAISLGITIPYLALAIFSDSMRLRMITMLAKSAKRIQIAIGLILVVVGSILILAYFGITLFY